MAGRFINHGQRLDPKLFISPIRHVAAQEVIERLAVIWREKMCQLMEHYIVDTCNPCFEKIEVKNDRSALYNSIIIRESMDLIKNSMNSVIVILRLCIRW